MQRLKNVLLFLLVLTISLSLFAGCDQSGQLNALEGSWYTVRNATGETAQALLLQINLYEQELALIEAPELQYCQSVKFCDDRTYIFRYETAASYPYLQVFFRNVFVQLYDNRAALNELYHQNFEDMSLGAFLAFYAQLYLAEDFDALLERFAGDAVIIGGEILDYGSFNLRGQEILCADAVGNTKTIRYALDETEALLLTYANSTELYSRDIPTP